MIEKLAIIGVGLIGGSVALALKEEGVVKEVVGCGRREANLIKAQSLGVIDHYTHDVGVAVKGADMVFLTAGMGGGTGTGSIAVAGEVAQELGAATIAIVTTPFSFEMGRRQKNANDGLTRLRPNTDTLRSK